MIFKEISEQIYQYVMNTETMMMIEFHIDSFNIFDDMTLLDMHTYVGMLEHQIEAKNKKLSNSTKISSQLRAMKSILNAMDI